MTPINLKTLSPFLLAKLSIEELLCMDQEAGITTTIDTLKSRAIFFDRFGECSWWFAKGIDDGRLFMK